MPRTKNPLASSSKRARTDEAEPSRRRRGDDVLMKATFINEQAEKVYHSSIVKKTCIPERGIEVLGTSLEKQIEDRHWDEFVSTPEVAVVPVVREFYANAKEQFAMDRSVLKTLVRGKWVHYDRRVINNFYGLVDEGPDDYTEWLDEEPNTDEALELLTIPGGKWNIKDGQILTLSKKYMTVETKAWHYFICGKLVPSNHYSDATRDRALLNYAIQIGLGINVGKVIEQSIISHLTGRVTVGLGHPSLIYQLCLQAGVPKSPTEEVHHPSPTINNKMIRNLERQTPTAAQGEAIAEGQAGTSSAPIRRPGKTAAHIPPPPQALAAIARIEKDLVEAKLERKALKREQKSIKARQDQMMHEQRQQFTYIQESLQIMAAMIQGGPSTTLPSPPHFPVYPPPTPSDSSEEEEEEDDTSDD